jgi:hypothetical protein
MSIVADLLSRPFVLSNASKYTVAKEVAPVVRTVFPLR